MTNIWRIEINQQLHSVRDCYFVIERVDIRMCGSENTKGD